MKRPLSKKEYVVGTFFVLAALLPLATAEDGGAMIEVLPPVASVALPDAGQLEQGTALPTMFELPAIDDQA